MFQGIEGVRAWLAWTVVASHTLNMAGYGEQVGIGRFFAHAANLSVLLFVIISGFVIANMIMTRRERYAYYLMRRAFRIFPAYLVCLALALPTPFLILAMARCTPWVDPVIADAARIGVEQLTSNSLAFHILAHLTLMHGAVPDGILMQSAFAFLPPAWSLSLEWQFYILAPAWVSLQSQRLPAVAVALGAALGWVLFEKGVFGTFTLPSLILGAGPYFLIGISTRMLFWSFDNEMSDLGRNAAPPVICILAIVALGRLLDIHHALNMLVALALWSVIALHSAHYRRYARRIWLAVFDSPVMVAAGRRSYSVYILHWPVLAFLAWVARVGLDLPQSAALCFIAIAGLVTTVLGSDLLFRLVETPAIALGKRLEAIGDYKTV